MMSTAIVREKQVIEEACRIAAESITNIRTVAGLRREADVIREYTEEIQRVEVLIRQKLRWRGILNSTMQASAFSPMRWLFVTAVSWFQRDSYPSRILSSKIWGNILDKLFFHTTL